MLPPPSQVGNTGIVLDDHRPDWEKQPFTGSVSLYHLGKVKPSPWDQLAKETEAIVAAMPRKPDRVSVTVTSFRLVKKDNDAPVGAATADNPRTAQTLDVRPSPDGRGGEVQQSGHYTRDSQAADTKPTPTVIETPFSPSWNLRDHPSGASCQVHAVVRLTDAGGQEQVLQVQSVGSSPNTSGTAYWGEALEFSVKLAVREYGRQFRQGVGLPPDG
jgi:hypothetical protein